MFVISEVSLQSGYKIRRTKMGSNHLVVSISMLSMQKSNLDPSTVSIFFDFCHKLLLLRRVERGREVMFKLT